MREKESFLWVYFSNLIKFFFLIYFHHETVSQKIQYTTPRTNVWYTLYWMIDEFWLWKLNYEFLRSLKHALHHTKNQTMNPIFFLKINQKKVKFEINCKILPFWCSLQNSQMKTPLMLLESPGGYLLLTGKSDILSVFKNRYRGGILECRQTIPLKIPPLGFSDVIGKPETSY